MALILYTQKDIKDMDVNNISEEFRNYFDGLSDDEKKSIIELRPELALVLEYSYAQHNINTELKNKDNNQKETVVLQNNIKKQSNEAPDMQNIKDTINETIQSDIYDNLYADKDENDIRNTSLTPVHALTVPDGQLECKLHRRPLEKLQLNYTVNGTHGKASYGCQAYWCADCHRLFLEKSKSESYAQKFKKYAIEYKFYTLEESQRYLESQMNAIEITNNDTLYVPDVWIEENPQCPIHNVCLTSYPYVFVGSDFKIPFNGFTCSICNKLLVRRTVALDIDDKCKEQGELGPKIESIRPKVNSNKKNNEEVIPHYIIEEGEKSEFPYTKVNDDAYRLDEKDIVVVSDSTYCSLDGHDTEQVEAVYAVNDKKIGKKQYYISLLGYCSQCQKFYMDEEDYNTLYACGRPEFDVIRYIDDDEYLITSGEVYNIERNHLDNLKHLVDLESEKIRNHQDYVEQTATASDYDEISALQWKKEYSKRKFEPLLENLNIIDEPAYRYRVDITFNTKTETYYIGSKDIEIDGERKVMSMANDMARALVNTRTMHYIKDGLQYDVTLLREFEIKRAYLYGYRNVKTDEDAVFRSGITDPFLIRVLNQRKRQHELVDIFITIQENQNSIVDESISRNIIVQGCAGSGKTMVMLHRLYTLKYNHPSFDFSNALILTPSKQFNLHIKDLADSLQIGNIERLSVEEYYIDMLNQYSSDFVAFRKLRTEMVVSQKFVDYIYSEEFLVQLDKAYNKIVDQQIRIGSILKMTYSDANNKLSKINATSQADWIRELKLRYTRFAVLIQKNMQKITDAQNKLESLLTIKTNIENRIIEVQQSEETKAEAENQELEQLSQKMQEVDLKIDKATAALEKANSEKYSEKIYTAYNYIKGKLAESSDLDIFKKVFELATKEFRSKNRLKLPAGMHRYELYAALWFCIKYFGKSIGTSSFICFDEGQDISYNEYKLIRVLNQKDVIYNIFGDTNQLIKTDRGITSWDKLVSELSAKMYYLNENYRNTNQITRFCNQSFAMDVKQTGVDGAKVREIPKRELEKELSFLDISNERVAILFSRKVYKKPSLELEILPDNIRNAIKDTIDKEVISYMYVDEVKGIEFDKVFVFVNKMSKSEKYIAYTRALSELIIVIDE